MDTNGVAAGVTAAFSVLSKAMQKMKEMELESSLKGGVTALLSYADVEDLDVLVDYLTDSGEGRLALRSEACQQLLAAKQKGAYTQSDRRLVAEEIKAFGGNTLINLFRREGVDYSEIVKDVANHLKVPFNADAPDVAIERLIVQKLFADSFDKMSPEERKKVSEDMNLGDLGNGGIAAATLIAGRVGGFGTYKMALIIANAVAKAILGKGLTLVGNQILTKVLSVMLGPVGWVISGVWTAFDLGSPAYRVTVPCVIQIAYIRQKAIAAKTSVSCPGCQAVQPLTAKFCSECGTSIGSSVAAQAASQQ